MSSSADILKKIKDEEIEYLDLRFTDPRGKLQHVSIIGDGVDEDLLDDGWMFDGCQPINISQERYSHTSEGAVDRRDTEWIFKKYQVMLPDQLASTFNQVQQTEKQDVESLYNIPSNSFMDNLPIYFF